MAKVDTDRDWHAIDPEEALDKLDSDGDGLDADTAARRAEDFGPNKLPEKKRAGLLTIILRQFTDPLIYILLVAGGVSLAIGNVSNALFIFAVLAINTGIGAWQEYQAESSASALQQVIRIRATCLRNGEEETVDAEALVPGDIVKVESGSAVPADIRLMTSRDLRADESLLTGESTPVEKDAEAEVAADATIGDRETMIHAGSSIISGRATGVVTRIGADTAVGEIATELSSGEGEKPPLVLRLQRLTRMIAILVLGAIAVLSVAQFIKGESLEHIFFLGVALAVSAIPAGLPVAITVALSIASTRMARRNVIVRNLPAVEGLGACTLVASDKTGTLTANELTVKRLRLAEGTEVHVHGEGYAPEGEITKDDEPMSDALREAVERFAVSGALCNEGKLVRSEEGDWTPKGSTVDVAFLALAGKLDITRDGLRDDHPRVDFIPFASEHRYAASFNTRDGETLAHVKGAPETIAGMCAEATRDEVTQATDQLAEEGFRVLAVARGSLGETDSPDADDLTGLDYQGLAGLIDPIRSEVPEAIEQCHAAGVQVRMITGDHPRTGYAIAERLGLADDPDAVITGQDVLEYEDDAEKLAGLVGDAGVFARVEPTQKTRIVEALQGDGHFVAVTGDGVNDAPALRTAHIGVAMGKGGTDVARNAADLILTDDHFASIVNGIEEGRVAYDNVRKVTWLLLSTGAAEVLLFFLSIFAGLPIPLTAIQLLWLNLVTNGIQDVALAFERAEPGVLKRKPRPPDEPIINRLMVRHVLASGGYIGLLAFAVYYYLMEVQGIGAFQAQNLTLLLMVLFENVHIFSCRSEKRSVFKLPLTSNPLIVLTVIAAQGVHIGAMFVPGLNDVLGIQPVSLQTWLSLLPIALSLILFDEVVKWIGRKWLE